MQTEHALTSQSACAPPLYSQMEDTYETANRPISKALIPVLWPPIRNMLKNNQASLQQ